MKISRSTVHVCVCNKDWIPSIGVWVRTASIIPMSHTTKLKAKNQPFLNVCYACILSNIYGWTDRFSDSYTERINTIISLE